MAGFKREKKNYDFKEEVKKEIIRYNTIFDYSILDIDSDDKESLISLEKNIVTEGKKIGEIAYKIGKSLEDARLVFKKYSTEENDPQSFVNWYYTLGLNKDQAYLFRGRYRLAETYPDYINNILTLSDRAIKETIHKKTPEELKEKIVIGELTSGKAIVEQRTNLIKMHISSTARNSEIEVLEAEVIESQETIRKRLLSDLEFKKRDKREREKNLKKLDNEIKDIEKQLQDLQEDLPIDYKK